MRAGRLFLLFCITTQLSGASAFARGRGEEINKNSSEVGSKRKWDQPDSEDNSFRSKAISPAAGAFSVTDIRNSIFSFVNENDLPQAGLVNRMFHQGALGAKRTLYLSLSRVMRIILKKDNRAIHSFLSPNQVADVIRFLIARYPKLAEIQMNGLGIGYLSPSLLAEIISKQSHLKLIDLRGSPLYDEYGDALAGALNLETLRVSSRCTPAFFEKLSKLPRLRSIEIYGTQRERRNHELVSIPTPVKEEQLESLSHLTSLEDLKIIQAQLPFRSRRLKDFRALKSFSWSKTAVDEEDTELDLDMLKHISHIPNLTQLSLYGLTNGLPEVFPEMPQLVKLEVGSFTKNDLAYFSVQPLTHLKELHIWGKFSQPASDRFLSDLQRLPQLTHLRFSAVIRPNLERDILKAYVQFITHSVQNLTSLSHLTYPTSLREYFEFDPEISQSLFLLDTWVHAPQTHREVIDNSHQLLLYNQGRDLPLLRRYDQ